MKDHFTPEQRNELSALLRAGVKKKDIATCLGKHRTTIWRESQRNGSQNGRYYARKAKRLAKERRIKANSRSRKIERNKWLRSHIIKKLKRCWSPEQISGRLKRRYKTDKTKRIGKGSIYKFVYSKEKRPSKIPQMPERQISQEIWHENARETKGSAEKEEN